MSRDADRTRKTYSQASRILQIYGALANARGGLTLAELEERTGVTRRTRPRDLVVLQDDFLIDAVEVDDRGRKRWRLLPAGPSSTVSFTRGELAALQLGRSMLAFLEQTELGGDMRSAFDKVTSRLGGQDGALDRKLYALPDAPPTEASSERYDDLLNEVLSALLREQQLELDYPPASDQPAETLRLDPLTLVYFRGRLYLVARIVGGERVKPFALHRVADARWLRGAPASVPADYHPASFFSSSFGLFTGGEPTTVRVRFEPGPARYARERRWHESQGVVDHADGGCEMRWQIPLTPDLESWLLSFGEGARVLEPAALRERLAQRLTAAAAAYGA